MTYVVMVALQSRIVDSGTIGLALRCTPATVSQDFSTLHPLFLLQGINWTFINYCSTSALFTLFNIVATLNHMAFLVTYMTVGTPT